MKLQQLEYKSSCEKCIFASYDNDIQVGCKAGRLEKFKVNSEICKRDEKTWFLLKRFCNLYREENISLEEARQQIALKFAIVIYDYEDLENETAIKSAKNIQYDKSKFKIIFSSKHNSKAGCYFDAINTLQQAGINSELVINLCDIDRDYTAFNKGVGASHFIKMNSSIAIPENLLSEIDKIINDDLEQIIMFEKNSITCLPFWLVNKEYTNYNDYDLMTESIKSKLIKTNAYKSL